MFVLVPNDKGQVCETAHAASKRTSVLFRFSSPRYLIDNYRRESHVTQVRESLFLLLDYRSSVLFTQVHLEFEVGGCREHGLCHQNYFSMTFNVRLNAYIGYGRGKQRERQTDRQKENMAAGVACVRVFSPSSYFSIAGWRLSR